MPLLLASLFVLVPLGEQPVVRVAAMLPALLPLAPGYGTIGIAADQYPEDGRSQHRQCTPS